MYSGLEDPAKWVLPAVLMEQASLRPEAQWLVFTSGTTLTFGQAADESSRLATYLAEQGVSRGDRVVVLLPGGPDFVRVWLALGLLGATAVLLNTELRGTFLRHQLDSSASRLLVIHEDFMKDVTQAAPMIKEASNVLVVDDGASNAWHAWKRMPRWKGPLPEAHETACIMYTSGTSGPSKGTLMPHAHCMLFGIGCMNAFEVTHDDVMYVTLPLYHANALLMCVGGSLIAGITAVIRPRFSARAWLSDIREHGVTITNLLGALASFVIGTVPTSLDRQHSLRAICNGPNRPEHDAIFKERFGVPDVLGAYGMTEVNIVVWGRIGHPRPGAIGWINSKHFEVMVADPQSDAPRAPGELGEILVRPKVPFGFMAGYLGMPEKTVEAWRNLWFHTGDAGTLSADGLLIFVDRFKDCIRRRGQNISPSEVEDALSALPGVAELTAYAVASDIEGGEDEVMLAMVAHAGHELDIRAIAAIAEDALPKYARPRFFIELSQLPKTGTGKVQRAELRKRGNSGAWDRDEKLSL